MVKKTQLTMSNGSKSEVEKYKLAGFEDLVVELRKRTKKIAELQEAQQADVSVVMNFVRTAKLKQEKEGRLYKTFVLESSDGVPAQIIFKNAFSKLPAENEEKMRELIGDVFDRLYDKQTTSKIKPKADMEELRKILGERVGEFFKDDEVIVHQKEFMEKRAQLRKDCNAKVNKAIDDFTEQCQAKPDLRLKG